MSLLFRLSFFFIVALCFDTTDANQIQESPLVNERWYRLLFCATVKPEAKNEKIGLFNLSFSKSAGTDTPRDFLSWWLSFDKGKIELRARIRYSADSARDKLVRMALESDSLYNLETGFRFKNDTLVLSLFCNGVSLMTDSDRVYTPRQYVSAGWITDTAPSGWRIQADGISKPDRLYSMPPKPHVAGDSVDDRKIILKLSPFDTRFKGETLEAVQWRLRKANEPGKSYFDELSEDPGFFSNLKIPNFCSPGKYFWQARFRNNFGNWGEWSSPCSLTVKEKLPFYTVDSLWITKPNDKKALAALQPERWYRVWMKVSPKDGGWDQLGYFILRMSHKEFLFGNPINKGGVFRSADNYIFNLSLQNGKWALFEKKEENSLRSDILPDGAIGKTLDASAGSIIADTGAGLFSFKFRLLGQALPGDWQATAYGVTTTKIFYTQRYDRLTDLRISFFLVSQPSQKGLPILAGGFLSFLLLTGLWLIFRFRPVPNNLTPAPSNTTVPPAAEIIEDSEFKKIREYIEQNIGNLELQVGMVRKALGFSKNYFFAVLNRNKIASFPNYINELRINKAKNLLKDPNLNITEIGFSVGYSDSSYFSRVFKTLTGTTPSEYREKLHS